MKYTKLLIPLILMTLFVSLASATCSTCNGPACASGNCGTCPDVSVNSIVVNPNSGVAPFTPSIVTSFSANVSKITVCVLDAAGNQVKCQSTVCPIVRAKGSYTYKPVLMNPGIYSVQATVCNATGECCACKNLSNAITVTSGVAAIAPVTCKACFKATQTATQKKTMKVTITDCSTGTIKSKSLTIAGKTSSFPGKTAILSFKKHGTYTVCEKITGVGCSSSVCHVVKV